MKKLNNSLIALTVIASYSYAVRDLIMKSYDRLACSLSIILVLLVPKILRKLFKLKISKYIELVYIIFVILAHFFGSVVNLYNTTSWYDLFAHFISGVLTAILSVIIMKWFGVYNKRNKGFNIIFMISFVLMVASIWEFIEFSGDHIFNLNLQHAIETGVTDTIEDMLMAFSGSIIVLIIYLLDKKNKMFGSL